MARGVPPARRCASTYIRPLIRERSNSRAPMDSAHARLVASPVSKTQGLPQVPGVSVRSVCHHCHFTRATRVIRMPSPSSFRPVRPGKRWPELVIRPRGATVGIQARALRLDVREDRACSRARWDLGRSVLGWLIAGALVPVPSRLIARHRLREPIQTALSSSSVCFVYGATGVGKSNRGTDSAEGDMLDLDGSRR